VNGERKVHYQKVAHDENDHQAKENTSQKNDLWEKSQKNLHRYPPWNSCGIETENKSTGNQGRTKEFRPTEKPAIKDLGSSAQS